MRGERNSPASLQPIGRELPDGAHLICVWTSEELLTAWLSQHGGSDPTFSAETSTILRAFLQRQREEVRYLIVDPWGDENPQDDSFDLASVPASRLIDLHTAAGRVFALSRMKRRRADALPLCRVEFQLERGFFEQSGIELRARGSFDDAKRYLERLKILE